MPVLWPSIAILVLVLAGCAGHATGSIGAILGKANSDGRLFVRTIPADMGAARAGIEEGDEIIAIDGHDARAMTTDEVHKALKGDVGSTVVLTVERGGARRDVKVVRGPLRAGWQ